MDTGGRYVFEVVAVNEIFQCTFVIYGQGSHYILQRPHATLDSSRHMFLSHWTLSSSKKHVCYCPSRGGLPAKIMLPFLSLENFSEVESIAFVKIPNWVNHIWTTGNPFIAFVEIEVDNCIVCLTELDVVQCEADRQADAQCPTPFWSGIRGWQ